MVESDAIRHGFARFTPQAHLHPIGQRAVIDGNVVEMSMQMMARRIIIPQPQPFRRRRQRADSIEASAYL